MNRSSFHILRVAIAVTFIWIGVLIFQAPDAWGHLIRPWAQKFIPIPIAYAMIATAVLDVIVGVLLLIDSFVWVAALLGTLHLAAVIITVGVNPITIRDLGLLGASAALAIDAMPETVKSKIYFRNYIARP